MITKGGGKVKKQTLTKQDIQKELLAKLNERKPIAVFLTVIILLGAILYPIHLIHYLNETPFDYTDGFKSPDLTPTAAMFVVPLAIILLIITVLHLYYVDLYRIKKGKFEITEDKLCQKDRELRQYYRRSKKENALYFHCGRIAVEDTVYSYSNVGDTFYIVTLNPKRNPRLVYHKKYYEINPDPSSNF